MPTQNESNFNELLARLFGWLMNRHNAKMNTFAVEQLELLTGTS